METILGVGLIARTADGRLLILEELTDKPLIKKLAGMLTVPFETTEDGETPIDTVQRLMYEEIGFTVPGSLRHLRQVHVIVDESVEIRIDMYLVDVAGEFVAEPVHADVAYYGWLHPDELRDLPSDKRRPEVIPALHACNI